MAKAQNVPGSVIRSIIAIPTGFDEESGELVVQRGVVKGECERLGVLAECRFWVKSNIMENLTADCQI